MKQSWTRFVEKVKGTPEQKVRQFDLLFWNHHKNSDELITDLEGNPVAAIYLTPKAYTRINLIKFFESLRQTLLFPSEREIEQEGE